MLRINQFRLGEISKVGAVKYRLWVYVVAGGIGLAIAAAAVFADPENPRFTAIFGVFALIYGCLTFIARLMHWRWFFSQIDHNHSMWRADHLLRYTVIPLALGGFVLWRQFIN